MGGISLIERENRYPTQHAVDSACGAVHYNVNMCLGKIGIMKKDAAAATVAAALRAKLKIVRVCIYFLWPWWRTVPESEIRY
jgi:hypothetical protein